MHQSDRAAAPSFRRRKRRQPQCQCSARLREARDSSRLINQLRMKHLRTVGGAVRRDPCQTPVAAARRNSTARPLLTDLLVIFCFDLQPRKVTLWPPARGRNQNPAAVEEVSDDWKGVQ